MSTQDNDAGRNYTPPKKITAAQLIERLKQIPGDATIIEGRLVFKKLLQPSHHARSFEVWLTSSIVNKMHVGDAIQINRTWVVAVITDETTSKYQVFGPPNNRVLRNHVSLRKIVLVPYIGGIRYYFSHESEDGPFKVTNDRFF